MTYYRIIDDMDVTGDELVALIHSLPSWRREEAERFKFESGKRECALSYHLLCSMLQEHFGITERPRFALGEHGKPALEFSNPAVLFGNMLPNTALLKPNIYFNLSHCHNAIACIVSDEGEVGIDVECTGRYKPSLAEYCMSAAEVQSIVNAGNPDLEFTRLWTMKEALLKFTGEGLTDDMKDVLLSPRVQNVTFETIENTDKKYVCTLAHNGRALIASRSGSFHTVKGL